MRKYTLTLLLYSFVSAYAFSKSPNESEPTGFYWYDNLAQQNKDELEEKLPTPPPAVSEKDIDDVQQEKVQLDASWIRENFPKLIDKAINQPTDTNLANFYYAQRLMMDYASRFSAASKEFFHFETALQESRRRPMESFALNSKVIDVKKSKSDALKKVFARSGIWVFSRSDCPYCTKQAPILDSMVKRYHADVLLIAQDGQPMPGFDLPMVPDRNLSMSRQFAVNGTPTMFLVTKDKQVVKLAEGMLSRDALLERVMVASRKLGLISEREYEEANIVHNEIMLADVEQVVELDKASLESDEMYLNHQLKLMLLKQQMNKE